MKFWARLNNLPICGRRRTERTVFAGHYTGATDEGVPGMGGPLCVCVCGYLKNWFKNSCTPRGVPHSEWICLEIGARSVGCVCRVPGQNGHLKSLFSTIYWTLTTPSRWAPHVPVGGVERIIHEFRSSTCLMVSLRGLIDFRQLVVKWPFHARRSFPSGPQSIMGALVLDVIVWLLEKSRFFIIIFFWYGM